MFVFIAHMVSISSSLALKRVFISLTFNLLSSEQSQFELEIKPIIQLLRVSEGELSKNEQTDKGRKQAQQIRGNRLNKPKLSKGS